ncbi:MAG: substrate-binding domain-containing protein, partial [Chloroflexota bacterium]
QDASVLGFDDIPMASWGSYQLTTISQNVDDMIQATIELMQAKIANPLTSSRTVHVAGELIVRSSVKNL